MLGVLDPLTRMALVHTLFTKHSSDFVALLGLVDQTCGPVPGQTRKPVVLVLDNGPIHTSKATPQALAARPWLTVEWLPRYAPERLLVDGLEDAGFTVLVAADGVSALLVVGRVTPDVILMDAVMPELDGFERCSRIRRRPECAAAPVIFMTGLSETESVLRGFEAGGVDCVTKPVSPCGIIARINVHIANARRTRSAHAARLLGEGGRRRCGLPSRLGLRRIKGGQAGALEIAGSGRMLELTLVGSEGVLVRLSEVTPTGDAALLRQHLGVTLREAEVLLWLARGKQNRDILGLSSRTVDKHLKQIYAKLDVGSRVGAAAVAMRALR